MPSMKINTVLCLFLAGSGLFLIVRCAALQSLVEAQQPTVSVKGVRVSALSFESATLLLDAEVTNPNGFSVTGSGYDYKLSINSTQLISGADSSSRTIRSNGKTVVQVPIWFVFKDLLNLASSLKNQDSASFRIDCGFQFDLPLLGPVRIPLAAQGHVPVIHLPEFKIRNLSLKNLSLTRADLDLSLDVENPNPFSITMDSTDCVFQVDGKTWSTISMTRKTLLEKHKTNQVILPISLNFSQIGQTVVKVLQGNASLKGRIAGSAKVGTSLPALSRAVLPFDISSDAIRLIKP
jgi:LEA14-like dessication related protein